MRVSSNPWLAAKPVILGLVCSFLTSPYIFAMFLPELVLLIMVSVLVGFASTLENLSFTYNGFLSAGLSLEGMSKRAYVTPNGQLQLSGPFKQEKSSAFYPDPVTFKNSVNSSAFSFSTTFVFAIQSDNPDLGGHGLAFVIAPTRGLPDALPSKYLGLFNSKNTGDYNNHIVAVELDTVLSSEFKDINGNHVGIDINGLVSEQSEPAGYHMEDDTGSSSFQKLSLDSGNPQQVWVDYHGISLQMNVTLAPVGVAKPKKPLLSLTRDLSPILKETMYVGFSSATGSRYSSHYVLGWSFKTSGVAQALDLSKLGELPGISPQKPKRKSKHLLIVLPLILMVAFSIVMAGVIYRVLMKKKFAEVLEDWELEHGPSRFKYKDLHMATRGFRDTELLGRGGFGSVYHGVLPGSKLQVAVKRVSHGSRQGMKEFVAEIVSIGRLRHRNLVPLLGYCRRKGELLLVYEYMPNKSLDKFLYDQSELTLDWKARFRVIKGVAAGLFYLHEGWEQLVIHRDVKASNVLLDDKFNARLGDFGLSRLYDHGADPLTTDVAGTFGYLAPEYVKTCMATTSTDVYAFGVFLLEVVCGRKPIESRPGAEYAIILVDWVDSCWKKGGILEAADLKMELDDCMKEEVELVMKLGLLCSHSEPSTRPSMHQVVLYLDGSLAPPDLPPLIGASATFSNHECLGPGFTGKAQSSAASCTASVLFEGR